MESNKHVPGVVVSVIGEAVGHENGNIKLRGGREIPIAVAGVIVDAVLNMTIPYDGTEPSAYEVAEYRRPEPFWHEGAI